MPLDNPDLLGTERDGTPSREYCRYCYQQGAFTSPDMTLREMSRLVVDRMEKLQIEARLIDQAVSLLPSLKRWKTRAGAGS